MRVKIVDKKEDVMEMTIEELVERSWIGAVIGSQKYMAVSQGCGYTKSRFQWAGPIRKGVCGNWSSYEVLNEMLREDAVEEIHAFGSAKELYLWMAE